ncbi:hypothetical protein SAMN02746041_01687, partial [Desulfacinum hydrothermale DSM 13146]
GPHLLILSRRGDTFSFTYEDKTVDITIPEFADVKLALFAAVRNVGDSIDARFKHVLIFPPADPEPLITASIFLEEAGSPALDQALISPTFRSIRLVWNKTLAVPARRGAGVIQGTVLVAGEPAHRRVTLFDRHTMRPLAITWSDPTTGEYRFDGYDPRFNYLVVCGDYTQSYNAAVADWVRPEVSE